MSKLYIYVYLSLKGDQTFLNVSERERGREKKGERAVRKRELSEREKERDVAKRERERERN